MIEKQSSLALWDTWMAIALVGALATQIQIAGAGVGATMLLVGLLPATAAALLRGSQFVPKDALVVFLFWTWFFAALCLGAIASVVLALPVDLSLVVHDAIAYVLLAAFTLTLAALPDRSISLRRIQWAVAVFGAFMAVMQLLNALGAFAFRDIDPWYWDRMRGWAENPNQFALLSLVTGFCALALLDKEPSRLLMFLAVICSAINLAVGLLSQSNAYTLVAALGLLAFVALKVLRGILAVQRSGVPAVAICCAFASLVAGAAVLMSSVVDLHGGAQTAVGGLARKNDDESADGALRLALWREAVATGLRSAGLGFGPGPHLAIPPSLIAARKSESEPKNLVHPKVGLAPNFEAHNTMLELFVQGGAIAVISFAALLVVGIARAWKAAEDGLIVVVLTVVMFGSFHVVFRHPIVWFCFSLALFAGNPKRAVAGRIIMRTEADNARRTTQVGPKILVQGHD